MKIESFVFCTPFCELGYKITVLFLSVRKVLGKTLYCNRADRCGEIGVGL